MSERDPSMLRVPGDRRDRAKRENSEQPVQTWSLEFLPQPRRKDENEKHTDDFKGVRKSTQKSETDQQASQRPPKRKTQALFNREPKRKHRCDPKEDRQRIGGHHKRADIEYRRNVERDHGPKPNVFVKQAATEIKKKESRASGKNRTPKADAEFGCAKNGRARANCECDSRTFAKIAGRQPLRPHPVMRFIKFEIGRSQHRQPNHRQRSDKKPNCSRFAHSVGLTIKPG